jgi:hypothetical protein
MLLDAVELFVNSSKGGDGSTWRGALLHRDCIWLLCDFDNDMLSHSQR